MRRNLCREYAPGGASTSPRSSSRPTRAVSSSRPNRCGPKKLGSPTARITSRIAAARSVASETTSRTVMRNRLPARCPVRSLLPCGRLAITRIAGVSIVGTRSATDRGTDTNCRVTASRSLRPAIPISPSATPSTRPRCLIRSPAATPRFSIHRNRCAPSPLGSYAGISSTSKSSGHVLIVPPIPASVAVRYGTDQSGGRGESS